MPNTEPPPPPAAQAELIVLKRSFHQPKRPDGHRIGRKLRAAVEHVAKGLNISQAAKCAGMSRHGLSIALQRQHVVALLEQTVRAGLLASAGKAANRLDHLIGEARSEYVQLEASKAVLDRAGYGVAAPAGVAGDVVIQINL